MAIGSGITPTSEATGFLHRIVLPCSGCGDQKQLRAVAWAYI